MSDEQIPFLSMRDAVMEIRDDVKALDGKLERIDREGSIGTKQELDDHEHRLRAVEKNSSRLAGAWGTVVILSTVLTALAGLSVALFAALQ